MRNYAPPGLAIQNRAAAIKFMAEQRAGRLLKQVERSKGGRGKTPATLAAVYEKNGIAPRTGRMWQIMAAVPEETVRELEASLTAQGNELSSTLIYHYREGDTRVRYNAGVSEWYTLHHLQVWHRPRRGLAKLRFPVQL